jgi:hypothetical protein
LASGGIRRPALRREGKAPQTVRLDRPANDGSRTSLIVRSPGAAESTAGIEFTAIDAVAMSPCTPPMIRMRL